MAEMDPRSDASSSLEYPSVIALASTLGLGASALAGSLGLATEAGASIGGLLALVVLGAGIQRLRSRGRSSKST